MMRLPNELDKITSLPIAVKDRFRYSGVRFIETVYSILTSHDVSDIISDEDKEKVLLELSELIPEQKRIEIDNYIPPDYGMGLITEDDE